MLEREIGSGGMSRVFLGRDEVLNRPVAVKVLSPGFEGTDIAQRFRREGRTAARLSHPNIIQVYDAGQDELDGRQVSYIVMEYVSGGDLKRLIDKRGRVSGLELSPVAADLTSGLAHAHERGVIHRDVKPHNVLMEPTGGPKLTDFGIARALDTLDTHHYATRTGHYLGTALYSSPEQLSGAPVSPKTDVYSLGATLYHAAVGEPPFTGGMLEVAGQHVNRQPVPPRERGAEIPAELEALILGCLAKDPSDRPETAELHAGFLRVSGATSHPTGAAASGGYPGHRLRTAVNRLAVPGLVSLVLILGAGGLYAALGSDTGEQPPQGAAQDAPIQPAGEPTAEDQAEDLSSVSAAQTVANLYVEMTIQDDYASSYDRLSERLRQSEYPTQSAWQQSIEDIRAVTFPETPTSRASNGEATVEGPIQLLYEDRIEQGAGTWDLVDEDGEWKLDEIELQTQRMPGS